jgi:hypothetical protein
VFGLRDSEYADKTPQALVRFSELVHKEKKPVAEAYAQTLNEITNPKPDPSTAKGIKAGTKIGNRTVSKTGKENRTGRTVIQFTDGTMTYAD